MIEENISLRSFNTFGIDVKADYFARFTDADQLTEHLIFSRKNEIPTLILGGGSNILFTKDFNGIVLKNEILGLKMIEERGDTFIIEVGSGVIWHEFVNWCIENKYQGVENLSLIPGCVGAAPIQNIGAYGIEQKKVFHSLEAVELSTGSKHIFTKEECKFGYRDSVFKNECKGKFAITKVVYALKRGEEFNLSYGAIEQELLKMGVEQPSLRNVSDAVCNIRRGKLPDPLKIGNAGSFFKNPEVPAELYEKLKLEFPELVAYPTQSGNFKLAAGWLIEKCGWKGKIVGNTGSHKDQALVLVNYGNASGTEIFNLALKICESVKSRFNVVIEPEVNIM